MFLRDKINVKKLSPDNVDVDGINKRLRVNVWKYLGIFAMMDAVLILLTPNASLQGAVTSSLHFEGFSYIYGTLVFMAGFTSVFHPDRFTRQTSVLIYYVMHTLLLFMFLTAPQLISLSLSILDSAPPTIEASDIHGLTPFLKYTALCLMVLIYYDFTPGNGESNS